MIDLIHISFAWINLPFTLALFLVVVYWGLMIAGVVHDGHSDLDADGDLDGAHDAHADVDGGADGHTDGDADTDADAHDLGAVGAVLKFLHVGQVPLTAVLSVLAVCLWSETVLGNWYFNPGLALGPALLLLMPNLFIAAILTRVILIPVAPFLRQMNAGVARKVDFVGQVGTVKSEDVTERRGQAEILLKGVSVLVNVRSAAGVTLCKGDSALIVSHDETKGTYEVTKM
jgi:hypothetical protein